MTHLSDQDRTNLAAAAHADLRRPYFEKTALTDAVEAIVAPYVEALARIEALAASPHVISVQTIEGDELAPVVWPHEIRAAAALDQP